MAIDVMVPTELMELKQRIGNKLRQVLSRTQPRDDEWNELSVSERQRVNTDKELFQKEWAMMSPYIHDGIQSLREDIAFIQSSVADSQERSEKIQNLFSFDEQFFLHYCGEWKAKVPNAQVLTEETVRRFFFEKAKEEQLKLQM